MGRSPWERWRLAGEFRFSFPDWPAGRRRSQEVYEESGLEPHSTENVEETKFLCVLFVSLRLKQSADERNCTAITAAARS